MTPRRFHLENGSVGGGVVLRTDAKGFVQLRSVGRVCLLQDRHESAKLPDGRLDVIDGEGWGTGAESRVQLGLSRTLLFCGVGDPAADRDRVAAGVERAPVLRELASSVVAPPPRFVGACGALRVSARGLDELLGGLRDALAYRYAYR